MQRNQLEILEQTTSTTAFDGDGVDVSAVNTTSINKAVLVVEVINLSGRARLEFADSVNGFVAKLAGPTLCVANGSGSGGPVQRYAVKLEDFPDLRLGVADAELRISVTRLTGTNPTITLRSWLEY